MVPYDIIIIGGGVVGTAISRALSRYKLRCAVLEKEAELAFGVSKSNSGIVHPGTQNPPDSLKGRLCVEGNRLMRDIAHELGVDFKEVGELIVAHTVSDIERLQEIKRDAELLGVPGLQMVDRDWLLEHEPHLSSAVIAALYAPTAGIISPYRLTYDLAENAKKNGVDFYCNRKVIGITPRNHEQCFTITTSQETFQSRLLINAAGLFSDEIARMLGITDFTIRPRKGEEYLLDKKKEYITNHLIFPLPTKTSKGVLIIKTSDGNPMIGPTAYMVDDKTDLETTECGRMDILEQVQKLVPAISGNDIIAYFAGLRPVAGDDFIIRNEPLVPGCITVAGIQSPGLTAAPAIARMVVDLVKEQGVSLKKKWFFHKYRAKSVHLFAIPLRKTKRLIKKNPAYGDIVCRCEMVSKQEIVDAIKRGARTMDGIKFRTRAQAGRCHGSFCTTRIMKILEEETGMKATDITKRGGCSCLVKGDRQYDET